MRNHAGSNVMFILVKVKNGKLYFKRNRSIRLESSNTRLDCTDTERRWQNEKNINLINWKPTKSTAYKYARRNKATAKSHSSHKFVWKSLVNSMCSAWNPISHRMSIAYRNGMVVVGNSHITTYSKLNRIFVFMARIPTTTITTTTTTAAAVKSWFIRFYQT